MTNFFKEPWDTPQRATPKSCYPCKKNLKTSEKFSKVQKISKNIWKKTIHAFQNAFPPPKKKKRKKGKRNKFHKKNKHNLTYSKNNEKNERNIRKNKKQNLKKQKIKNIRKMQHKIK